MPRLPGDRSPVESLGLRAIVSHFRGYVNRKAKALALCKTFDFHVTDDLDSDFFLA
jgi:hypothetical protein